MLRPLLPPSPNPHPRSSLILYTASPGNKAGPRTLPLPHPPPSPQAAHSVGRQHTNRCKETGGQAAVPGHLALPCFSNRIYSVMRREYTW